MDVDENTFGLNQIFIFWEGRSTMDSVLALHPTAMGSIPGIPNIFS